MPDFAWVKNNWERKIRKELYINRHDGSDYVFYIDIIKREIKKAVLELQAEANIDYEYIKDILDERSIKID